MSMMELLNRAENKAKERKPEVAHTLRTKYAWMSAGAARAAGVKPATLTVNDNDFIIFSFADGQEQEIQANVKIPDDMDTDEDCAFCIGWSSPTISQDCDWEVTYLVSAVGEDTDQAGTTLQEYEESSSTADGLVVSDGFTIAAANVSATDICFHVVIARDGNDASDNLGDVAELHGIALKYTPK